jgi:hypothetical protein
MAELPLIVRSQAAAKQAAKSIRKLKATCVSELRLRSGVPRHHVRRPAAGKSFKGLRKGTDSRPVAFQSPNDPASQSGGRRREGGMPPNLSKAGFCWGRRLRRRDRQRGGRSSLASQPMASVFMGSTATETFSMRWQVEHLNVRASNPRVPAEVRAKAILCLHTGHIGRSLIQLPITVPQDHRQNRTCSPYLTSTGRLFQAPVSIRRTAGAGAG